MKNLAAIVLAAGKGTRLASGAPSPKPKVMYEIGGKPMVLYTLDILRKLGLEEIVIVVGHKASDVVKTVGEGFKFATQEKRLGTAHAVSIGLQKVSGDKTEVIVLNGDDSAFYKVETIKKVLNKHIGKGNTITFVSLQTKDPKGLGRVIRKGGRVVSIVEDKVATKEQKKIREINDGVYVFKKEWLKNNLPTIKKSPVGEYYLVDLISLAVSQEKNVDAFKLSDSSEWFGVNTPEELTAANTQMQNITDDASEN
ncbi:NTP transferase domain-containing protein [Patescibacteria group bacterium]|nr:NTP transferase domain-containing protein [Patescibacteria group bacterium]